MGERMMIERQRPMTKKFQRVQTKI